MGHCIYCRQHSGFLSQICKHCRQLIKAVKKLPEGYGYRMLLEALLETGVGPEQIDLFLDADPTGQGSLNQQITARMTNQLMSALGQRTHMTTDEVKKIQSMTASGRSFLNEPDVRTHPKKKSKNREYQ